MSKNVVTRGLTDQFWWKWWSAMMVCDGLCGIAQSWFSLSPSLASCFSSHQPFHSKIQKGTFSQTLKEKCVRGIARIDGITIFHLNKQWKAKFFLLRDLMFLVRLQGNLKLITLRSERVKRVHTILTSAVGSLPMDFNKWNAAHVESFDRAFLQGPLCVLNATFVLKRI